MHGGSAAELARAACMDAHGVFFIRAWLGPNGGKTAVSYDKWARVFNSVSTPELLYLLQAAPEVALTC
jgi:hypothetical protein